MPFLGDFAYDIFVSYSLTNDELLLDGEAWVRRFVAALEIKLRNLLPEGGKNVKSYYAGKGDLRFGDQLASCRDEAKRSALFLMIGSPRYLDVWPTSELRAFTDAGTGGARVFVAELLPLPAGQRYPDLIGDPLRAQFWRPTPRGAAQPFAETRGDFDVLLTEFATNMSDTLVKMSHARRPAANGRARDPRSRPILLARVTDDLAPLAERLRIHLEQFDLAVLPEGGFQEEGAAFRDEFAAQLDRAPLVVQLLGQYPARRTRDLPDGYDGFQAEAARAAPGCRLVQWRDPALDVAAIEDERHRALLSGNVDAMAFEPFKDMIVRLATAPPPPPPASRKGGSFVFIDADRVDAETARSVLMACRDRKIVAMMPEYGVDTPKDWRANYAECDRVAVIHERSDRAWLNAQLKMFVRSSAKRKVRQDCVIYLGPPPPKGAASLTIVHPDFVVVEAPDGDLDALIEQLA